MFSLLGEGDLIGCDGEAEAGKNEEILLPVALRAGDDMAGVREAVSCDPELYHEVEGPFSDMADITGEVASRDVSSLPSA